MEHLRNGHGGLWNCPRASQYSKETQEMLKMMMQESQLNNFQQRKLSGHLRKGEALPLSCNPTTSAPPPPQPKPKVIKTSAPLAAKPLRRQAETCKAGDNYKREMFRPSATRDLEKEKKRLQNILAGVQEDPKPKGSRNLAKEKSVEEEKDRFEEVLEEIEDRKQFLEEMTSVGMGHHYQNVINTEISQKIRELELIDKARSGSFKSLLKEEKKGENFRNAIHSL